MPFSALNKSAKLVGVFCIGRGLGGVVAPRSGLAGRLPLASPRSKGGVVITTSTVTQSINPDDGSHPATERARSELQASEDARLSYNNIPFRSANSVGSDA